MSLNRFNLEKDFKHVSRVGVGVVRIIQQMNEDVV